MVEIIGLGTMVALHPPPSRTRKKMEGAEDRLLWALMRFWDVLWLFAPEWTDVVWFVRRMPTFPRTQHILPLCQVRKRNS